MIDEDKAIAVFKDVSGEEAALSVRWRDADAEYQVRVKADVMHEGPAIEGYLSVAKQHDCSFYVDDGEFTFS